MNMSDFDFLIISLRQGMVFMVLVLVIMMLLVFIDAVNEKLK